jgi:hypothetical protein
VLHTWGQNLHLHPHVHCVVPGGGLAPTGDRWIPCRPGFFLPVQVLSRVFRGKFLSHLEAAFGCGQLSFHGQQEHLGAVDAFLRLTGGLRERDWVVYAQPPAGSPEQVLKYLARYVYRVAISNQRLLRIENDQVFFTWKDYTRENQVQTMALPAVEFIRRFLVHVLPSGFVRIRHYGLLANRHRAEKLQQCRQLLQVVAPQCHTDEAVKCPEKPVETVALWERCPACAHGRMIRVEKFQRGAVPRHGPEEAVGAAAWDSS